MHSRMHNTWSGRLQANSASYPHSDKK